MKYISVKKEKELKGSVDIGGSKNAVLPIIAACLLTDEECILENIPDIEDVKNMLLIIESLGAKIDWNKDKKTVSIIVKNISKTEPNYKISEKMRASFLVAGPLLSRCKEGRLPLPGGCAIGSRPINMHIKGFYDLGAHYIEKKSEDNCYIYLIAKTLTGKTLYLDYPSVGTTENLIMTSVLTEGVTILDNVAKEPEIVDLAVFLNKMGAKISGVGTDKIRITGVKKLSGVTHSVIPDRIEAATYIIAGVITRSDILVKNIIIEHIQSLISKLEDIGVSFEIIEENEKENLKVFAKSKNFSPAYITTLPYPGFPTDLQSLIMPLLTTINGESKITETVFENRFMQVTELQKLGASIEVKNDEALIIGKDKLKGNTVKATDLRSGAGLILTGLFADGKTNIFDIYHIERGYEDFIKKFKNLGADIKILEADNFMFEKQFEKTKR